MRQFESQNADDQFNVVPGRHNELEWHRFMRQFNHRFISTAEHIIYEDNILRNVLKQEKHLPSLVVGDAYLKLLLKIDEGEEFTNVRGWMYSSIINRLKNLRRDIINKKGFFFGQPDWYWDSYGKDLAEITSTDEFENAWKRLDEFIEQLDADEQTIYYMKFVHDMTYHEIADKLEDNYEKIKKRGYRIRCDIISLFNKECY
jgi:RNA polymerase sigma factor (sigma-70 family)